MIFDALSGLLSVFRDYIYWSLYVGGIVAVCYLLIIIVSNIVKKIRKEQLYSFVFVISQFFKATILCAYTSLVGCYTLSGMEGFNGIGIGNFVPGTTIFLDMTLKIESVEKILLYVPLGILLPLLLEINRSIIKTVFEAIALSSVLEVAQFVTKRGCFEIDDIILNSFGAIVGYVVYACIYDGYLGISKRIKIDVSKEKKKQVSLEGPFKRPIVVREWLLMIIQALPVVFMTFTIMGFSADTGEASKGMSRPVAFIASRILYVISGGRAVDLSGIENIEELLALQSAYLDLIEKVIRKCAHITEYALLALFVWALVFSRPYIKRWISYIVSLTSVLILGTIDELNQSGVVGRTGSIKDVFIDFSGAILMILIISIFLRHMLKKERASY